MPEIKTRDVTVKAIDKSAVATERMKFAYNRTKDKAEHGVYSVESSPDEYVADHISGGGCKGNQREYYQSKRTLSVNESVLPEKAGSKIHAEISSGKM